MVFVDFGVLGLALGFALGGRLGPLATLQVRRLSLAYAAIALQIAAFPSGVFPWSTPDGVARGLWLVSYGLLIAFILANRQLRGLELIAAGLACNLTAIVANGGLMPAKLGALRAAGLEYRLHNNSISAAHPHLSWLVDRWAAPGWLPFANVYSVGDVLIALGAMLVIAIGMRRIVENAATRALHEVRLHADAVCERVALLETELRSLRRSRPRPGAA